MDETATRERFETALETHEPGFGSFFLARLLGLEIAYGEDVCIVELDVRDFLYNPQGSVHGGILATVMDISAGHLIAHVTGQGAATLEMKVQFMRPALAGRLRCEGRFLKRGRAISYMESRMTDADGRLIAVATSTWAMPKT